MTSNDTPPVPPQIAYTGTWVDTDASEPGRGAILCIRSPQFWESWLLPLLQIINLASQIQPLQPLIDYNSATNEWHVGMNFIPCTSTQHPDPTDKYYQFEKSPDNKTWTWTADNSLLASQNSLTANNTTWSVNETSKLKQKCLSDEKITVYSNSHN
jgi:hypothetical protein